MADDSARRAAALLWEWREANGWKVRGRQVEVVVIDDGGTREGAKAACTELVESQDVFLIAGYLHDGGTGSGAVAACAGVAYAWRVPYVSLGVMKRGLSHDRYFALSMHQRAQGRLLADLAIDVLDAKRSSATIRDRELPGEPIRRFTATLKKRGGSVGYERVVDSNDDISVMRDTVDEMMGAGIEVVFVHTRLLSFAQLLQASRTRGFEPVWLGVGPHLGQGAALLPQACSGNYPFDGRFLSPVPALADRDGFDPRFQQAIDLLYPGTEPTEAMWRSWAASKALRRMLHATGRKLTRRRFVSVNENGRPIRTALLPPVRFTPANHLAARRIHLVEGNCDTQEWETTRRSIGDF